MTSNGTPLSLEVSSEEFVVLTLKTSSDGKPDASHVDWLAEALNHRDFFALHRSEDGLSLTLTVSEAFLAEVTPPKDLLGPVPKFRACQLKIDVKALGTMRDLRFAMESAPSKSEFVSASTTLGRILQDAAIPFVLAAQADGDSESWYIPQRHILAAGQAFVRAGHALRPSRRFWPSTTPDVAEALDVAFATSTSSSSTGRRRYHQSLQGQRFAGVFRLSRRESDPLHLGGGGRRPRQESKGSENAPMRLQAACGLYVEVDFPNQPVTASAALVEEASTAGRLSFPGEHGATVAGPTVVERHRLVDFQPPGPGPPSGTSFHIDGDTLVDDGGEEGYHDTWSRLQSSESGCVALELVHEHPPRNIKRHGCWLFCGSYFARVVGLPLGQGLVAGTCCSSLRQLRRLHGEAALRTELTKHYEASFGVVERPGVLRMKRQSCSYLKGHQATYLYDATKTGKARGGEVVVGDDLTEDLIHRLPDGTEQHWRKLEWSFDPFTLDQGGGAGKAKGDSKSNAKESASLRPDRSRSRSRSRSTRPKASAVASGKQKRPTSSSSSSDASHRSETRKLGMGLMHAPPAVGPPAGGNSSIRHSAPDVRKLTRLGEDHGTANHSSRPPAKIFQQAKEHANKFAAMDIVLKMASARAAKEEDPASETHPALRPPEWPTAAVPSPPPPPPPASPPLGSEPTGTVKKEFDPQTSQLLAALADAENGQGATASPPEPPAAEVDDGTTEEEDFVAEPVPGPPSDDESEGQEQEQEQEEEEEEEEEEEDEAAKKLSAKALLAARAAAEATNRRVKQKTAQASPGAQAPAPVVAAAEPQAPAVPQYVVLPQGPNQPPVVFAVAPTGARPGGSGAAAASGAGGGSGSVGAGGGAGAGSSAGRSNGRALAGRAHSGYVIDEAGNLVPGNQKVVADFVKASGFDRRATAAFKSLPVDVQVQMANEGRVEGKNPSAVIMSRIKQYEAQKQIAEALEADKKVRELAEAERTPPAGTSSSPQPVEADAAAATTAVPALRSAATAPVTSPGAAVVAAAAPTAAAPAQLMPQYTIAMMQMYPGAGMVPVAIPAAYSAAAATAARPSWPGYGGPVAMPISQFGHMIPTGHQPPLLMAAPGYTQPGTSQQKPG